MKLEFLAGDGVYFNGGVNYLVAEDDVRIYAEIPVTEGSSEDFGYITMKNAILRSLENMEIEPLEFWYDGQESFLAPDASADGKVYVEIESGDYEKIVIVAKDKESYTVEYEKERKA